MSVTSQLAPKVAVLDAERLASRPASLWRTALRRFLRRRSAMVGLFMLAILTLTAVFAPLIAPYAPNETLHDEGVAKRESPCIYLLGCPRDRPQHLMGIDGNVRDLFSRVVYGARYSLVIGFTTVSFAIVVGTVLGALAGYLGGWVDNVIMRVMDVLLAFPALLLAIAIVAVIGPGLINALLAIAIVTIPAYARVMRASVLSVKETNFIAASRALGASSARILFVSILPNAMTPLIVLGTLEVASAILNAAALSFLGLGAQPPTPEWGYMLSTERNQVFTSPHLVFFPGLAIMLTVLSFNLLGDGLRDALDPTLAHRGPGAGRA